jgi:hypothetical protein
MFGDYAIVGARTSRSGVESAAYIFEHATSGTWSEVAKLTGSGASATSGFARSVAIGSNIALVGAPNVVVNGITFGSAFLFQRSESGAWTQTGQILGGPWFSESLGNSLSLEGNYAAIGSSLGGSPFQAGQAYVYAIDPDGLAGDFNSNGVVDAADYAVWRKEKSFQTSSFADANGDGVANAADYVIWRANFGKARTGIAAALVPEPMACQCGGVVLVFLTLLPWRSATPRLR